MESRLSVQIPIQGWKKSIDKLWLHGKMSLHYTSIIVDTESIPTFHPSKPSATIPPSPIFRRLQSFFTCCMIEDWGGIFGLVSPWPWDVGRLLHSPNIFGDFGYGWYHGRKLRKAWARMLLNYIISLIK